MKDIAIYGAGGYGIEVACLINHINAQDREWNLIGYFDDTKNIGDNVHYGNILGGINELNNWIKNLHVVIAIGNPDVLSTLTKKITNPLIEFPNLIAPNVIFHDKETVKWGKGNIVFFDSIISCYTTFGNFNLLNNAVFVGHNSAIGSFNVINPATRISGDVSIGDVNFLGVCSIVLQKLTIGNNTKLSAGSCLYRNAQDGNLYVGNPAMMRLSPDKNKQ